MKYKFISSVLYDKFEGKDGYFAYPRDVALLHYHTGDTVQRATLLHYGQMDVVVDLGGWFHACNGSQTIEAGIKEGKNVFQMHHLGLRSAEALLLQEYIAGFAANFVRFAAWWRTQEAQPTPFSTTSVKQMVQVTAHIPAWVQVCLLFSVSGPVAQTHNGWHGRFDLIVGSLHHDFAHDWHLLYRWLTLVNRLIERWPPGVVPWSGTARSM